MALYFLLLDADRFHLELVPFLAASWRDRSFRPCRDLCAGLIPAVRAFGERYHLGTEEPLPIRVARDAGTLPFDRDLWRLLVGEVLLYAAADVPEFQTAPAALACLLAPAEFRRWPLPRAEFAPIQQAHHGSCDLVLGGFYRPEHAGWNDSTDMHRLAEYLAAVDPDRWVEADLASLPEVLEEDRAEELAFARDCLAALREMYERAQRHRQVVVCESLS
jgi:hypothetical protein